MSVEPTLDLRIYSFASMKNAIVSIKHALIHSRPTISQHLLNASCIGALAYYWYAYHFFLGKRDLHSHLMLPHMRMSLKVLGSQGSQGLRGQQGQLPANAGVLLTESYQRAMPLTCSFPPQDHSPFTDSCDSWKGLPWAEPPFQSFHSWGYVFR